MTSKIKPAVERRYPVDPQRSILAGLSLGGLFDAYVLFHQPDAFAGYVVMSPSLWWDNGLAFRWDEESVGRGRPLAARVYLSVGEKEETSSDDAGMVSNMKKLAARLAARGDPQLALRSEVLPGESHYSNFGAAFSCGLRFVLPPPPAPPPPPM